MVRKDEVDKASDTPSAYTRTGLLVGGSFIRNFLQDSPAMAFLTKACISSALNDAGLKAVFPDIAGTGTSVARRGVAMGCEINIGGCSALVKRGDAWAWC
jgi:hypothetical protein